jgi:hypothetical protein
MMRGAIITSADFEELTKEEAADKFKVEVKTIVRWEQQLGFRCKRKCRKCREDKKYSEMVTDGIGRSVGICRGCQGRIRSRSRAHFHPPLDVMQSHTVQELSAIRGVSHQTVRRWESELGVSCLRRCRACGAKKPVEMMQKDKLGRPVSVTKCQSCAKGGRKSLPEIKSSTDPEFLAVPQSLYEFTRRRIAKEEGRLHCRFIQGGVHEFDSAA